jgi:hypothetical protein
MDRDPRSVAFLIRDPGWIKFDSEIDIRLRNTDRNDD